MATNSPERWALAGRRVLTPSGLREAAILIDGERIDRVVERDAVEDDVPVEDVGERVIMPGVVDLRACSQEPGHGDWEGFARLTRAAAAGGVTTVADMPLHGTPVTATVEALEAKRWTTDGTLHVDVGFLGGLLPGYQDQIEPLAEAGVLAMVAYLGDPGVGEFRAMSETDLATALPALARLGLPCFVHPELAPRDIARALAEGSDDEDPRSYSAYRASRPSRFEVDGVELLVRLVRESGCAVHLGPLASRHALGPLRAARGEGLPISVDTAPHHLTFTAELIADGDTRFKTSPPIRGEEHREGLWQALGEGTLDCVASSHIPGPPSAAGGDFRRAFPGIASIELLLPATWTAALDRGFGLADLGRWLCRIPARRLGLGDRKGEIAPGFDADLVVWDPEATFEVDQESLARERSVTPWHGRTLFGVVERTYVRGRKAFDRWNGSGEPVGQVARRGGSAAADG